MGKVGQPGKHNSSSYSWVRVNLVEYSHKSISRFNIGRVHSPMINNYVGSENFISAINFVNKVFVLSDLSEDLVLDLHINHDVGFEFINMNLNSLF